MSANKDSFPSASFSGWNTVKFSSLCDITRGASPRPINDWISEVGVPWVKISDATATNGATTINSTREHIKPEARHKSVEVFPGDLILSNSATPGIPKFVGIRACIHDGWLLLRNFRGVEKPFAYYLLLHERQNLVDQGNGSVFTNLKTDILKNHQVFLPPLPEQRRIAHVLGTLDDKIENNRKTAKTLEAMAQAIFKSWFVDFDPVRAKMAGESRESICKRLKITPEILDLFPDRLVDSELGEIPEGWGIKPLGQLMDLEYGKPLKAEQRVHGDIPVYGSNGIIGWHNEQLVPGPGIIVGRKGNPGTVTWSESDFYPIDTTFFVVPKGDTAIRFLYLSLAQHNLASLGADSAVPGLNRHLAYISKQIVPENALCKLFDRITNDSFHAMHQLQKQSIYIGAARDTLLPSLMAGEVRAQSCLPIINQVNK